MALTNCPDCNREISTKAQTCPHCGAPGPVAFVQEFNRLVELESEAQKISIPKAKDPNKPTAARTIVQSSENGTTPPDTAGIGKKLEAKIARLESEVEYIKNEVGEITSDIKDLQIDSRTYFRIVWGGLIVLGVCLAGLMAKGFAWI